MPRAERVRRAELENLIREQAKDSGGVFVFPEVITPRKARGPSSLTVLEYIHLLLETGLLTRRQIARALGITPGCVSQHRKNARRKLGPEGMLVWVKFCKGIKTHNIFLGSLHGAS